MEGCQIAPPPPNFAYLFWDTPFAALDTAKHERFITERFLNEGDEHALAWLFEVYGEQQILATVKEARGLSRKTARCWQNFFDLSEGEMRCFGRR